MKPAYDITASWEDNYSRGPHIEGAFPPLLTEKKWKFLDFDVISPLGIAAGPLPNAKWILPYARLGFGTLTYKTVRSSAHPSHSAPNIVPVDIKGTVDPDLEKPVVSSSHIPALAHLSITNSFGNPCPAPSVWMAEIKKIKKEMGAGQVLPVSVYGTMHAGMDLQGLAADYAKAAQLAEEAGADAIEANLSCPNVLGDEDPNIFCSPTATKEIVETVRAAINIPFIIKVGRFPDKATMHKVLSGIAGKIDAIAAINTVPKIVLDPHGKPALPGREQSGICGAGIREHGLATVRMLAKVREELGMKFHIIGVGGVTTPQHVLDYLDAGAQHVHSATAAMWNPRIAIELQELLRKKE